MASSTAASSSPTTWPFQTTCESTVTVRFSSSTKNDETTTPPRFGVGYWSIRGLAAPIRMMLCAAKQDHTVYMYDCLESKDTTTSSSNDEWMEGYSAEKPRLRDAYQNSFMNLPYLVDHQEKLLLTQTNACLQYAGECLRMMGRTAVERARAVQLLCELYDLRNVMVKYAYAEPQVDAKRQAAACVEAAQEHFAKFEHHLANNQSATTKHFLVGDTFSAPDFHLFELVDQFDGLCKSNDLPDCLEEYPNVRAFQTGFAKLPENHFYLNSIFHQGLPYNYPIAHFGSAPGPTTYVRGQTKAPWMQLGTVELVSSSSPTISPCSQW